MVIIVNNFFYKNIISKYLFQLFAEAVFYFFYLDQPDVLN